MYFISIGEAVRLAAGQEHEIIELHCLAKGDAFCNFEDGKER